MRGIQPLLNGIATPDDLLGFANDLLTAARKGGDLHGRANKSDLIRDAIELCQESLDQIGRGLCGEEPPPTLRTGAES